VLGLLVGVGIVLWIFPGITRGLNLLGQMADRFGKGRLKTFARWDVSSKDELGELARLFKRIAFGICRRKTTAKRCLSAIQQRQARMNAQLARVTELLQEGADASAVARTFISEFAPVLGATHGLIYLEAPASEGAHLELAGTYAKLGDDREDGNGEGQNRS